MSRWGDLIPHDEELCGEDCICLCDSCCESCRNPDKES